MEVMTVRETLKPLVAMIERTSNDLSKALQDASFSDDRAGYLEVSSPALVANDNSMYSGAQAATLCSKIYSSIHYKRGFQSGRETSMAAGFLMVDPEIMDLADAVNQAKQRFSEQVIELGRNPGMKNKHRRNQKVAEALASGSDSAICLQQAYRKIQVLRDNVVKLNWQWISKPSRKKVSRNEAIELLENLKKHWPHNEALYEPQIKALVSLPEDARLVRELQQGSPALKVTVGYEETKFTSTGSWYYPKLSASMPVLIPNNGTTPKLNWPSVERSCNYSSYTGTRPSSRKDLICPSINLWS